MIKFRFYFDKDEETAWLNQMSADGWAMTGFFAGFFNFEKCDKGKWNYQVDFGDRAFAVSDEYREFMEDTGAEIVQTWGYWVFLRRLASLGKFELYTDIDSCIEHYKKILKMFQTVTILELVCFFIIIFTTIYGNLNGLTVVLFFPIIIALSCACLRTKNVINDLYEKKGVSVSRRKNISVFLPIGMLLLSVSLLTKDYVPHIITLALQIASIVFELLGLLRSSDRR